MNLTKTKQRVLQWSMLSVLITMLSPAAYAACPHSDFSTINKISHSSKSFPKNTKGAVFLSHRSRSVNLNAYQSQEAEYWQRYRHYVLPDIPTPLTANQFQIIDKTNNKQLTPKLVRLSALDAYPISERDDGYRRALYYIKKNRMAGCDKGKPLDNPYSFKQFSKLLNNKRLVEVTNEVKKAWGYFRVEPEESLQVGHTYEFSYTAGEVINGKKLSYSTVMKIGPEPIDLEALVPKIQPVEYEDFSNSRRRNFIYLRYYSGAYALYGRAMRYYLSPLLRQYDRQLQIISLVKLEEEGANNNFDSISLGGEHTYTEFMIKRFRDSLSSASYYYSASVPNEYYPLVDFPYYKHKAKVGFLEVEDQLYDTQTKYFSRVESGLYD